MITIRPETAADYDAMGEVTRLAFGRQEEARLVEELRALAGFIPELSLVAVSGREVVGHVLFSLVAIETGDGDIPALALAPVSVRPDRQRQGIGSALIREGLGRCRRLGHEIVVVLGHPSYYPRFGFTPARAKGLHPPLPSPTRRSWCWRCRRGRWTG